MGKVIQFPKKKPEVDDTLLDSISFLEAAISRLKRQTKMLLRMEEELDRNKDVRHRGAT